MPHTRVASVRIEPTHGYRAHLGAAIARPVTEDGGHGEGVSRPATRALQLVCPRLVDSDEIYT